jgi:Nucleotidyl transferase AbiEii toxin, Type IV TA system
VTSVSDGQQPLALTDFQVQVAELFFSLPAAQGFLLAGGAALVAQRLTSRPTQDLDFFTRVGATGVPTARDALEIAASTRGWSVERVRDETTFCRLVIHGDDDLLVDLALDSPPEHPSTASLIGPTFAPRELAGRKVVALFDRAEARDFADVFELSQHFSKDDLLAEASKVDRGFDRHTFAQMLRSLARFTNADLPAPEALIASMRDFFATWADQLDT